VSSHEALADDLVLAVYELAQGGSPVVCRGRGDADLVAIGNELLTAIVALDNLTNSTDFRPSDTNR